MPVGGVVDQPRIELDIAQSLALSPSEGRGEGVVLRQFFRPGPGVDSQFLMQLSRNNAAQLVEKRRILRREVFSKLRTVCTSMETSLNKELRN